MADASSTRGAPFRIGRVLADSLTISSRNILPFGLIALGLSLPVQVATWFMYSDLPGTGEVALIGSDLPSIALAAGDLLLGFMIEAALVIGIVLQLNGEKVSFGRIMAGGVSGMAHALGICVLLTIIVMLLLWPMDWNLGFAVPAAILNIYAQVVLWATIPAVVVEKRGFQAINRSLELTEGHRWRIFLILLAITVIFAIVYFLLTPIEDAVGSTSIEYLAIDWLITALLSMYWAVVGTVSYRHLREAREGPDLEQTAAVFD